MTRAEAIAELNVLHERLLNPKDCEDGCYSWEDGWYVEAIDMAIEALSAEARPTGEWIDIDNYYSMATCSHCHKVTMFEKWGEYIRPYNFCPNCGAKMYKGGEDE